MALLNLKREDIGADEVTPNTVGTATSRTRETRNGDQAAAWSEAFSAV